MELREIEFGSQDVSIASEPLDELSHIRLITPGDQNVTHQNLYTLCCNWRRCIFAFLSWEKLRFAVYVKQLPINKRVTMKRWLQKYLH